MYKDHHYFTHDVRLELHEFFRPYNSELVGVIGRPMPEAWDFDATEHEHDARSRILLR